MTAFPAQSALTNASLQREQVRQSLDQLYLALTGLLGTDGTQSAALATLGAPLNDVSAHSGAYTVQATDRGKLLNCTGAWTLTLLAAATAGAGYAIGVRNSGSGTITLDPSGSETVDSAATIALAAGETCLLVCTGSAWLTVGRTDQTTANAAQTTANAAQSTANAAQSTANNAVPKDVGGNGIGCFRPYLSLNGLSPGYVLAISPGTWRVVSDAVLIASYEEGSGVLRFLNLVQRIA